jgi:hypothetical protein
MPTATAPTSRERTGRDGRTRRAQLIAMLEEHASREYQAILRLVRERQCDSLADFAMAEHMRSLLSVNSQAVTCER